jgi:hypothetical protein
MKKLLPVLILLTLQLNGFSQKKGKRKIPPPVPPYKTVELSTDTLTLQEYALPILFLWEMNADTTLKPNTVFKELIKLTYGETEVNGNYSLTPLKLKKVNGNKNAREPEVPKMITRISYYQPAIANGVLTLKERGRPAMTLKIVYDKNKQLSHLRDVNTGAIYRHIENIVPTQISN